MKLKSIWLAAGVAILTSVGLPAWAQGPVIQQTFGNTPQGANPQQLEWTNGLFYGATSVGGVIGDGSIFSYNTNSQVLNTFFSFTNAAGSGSSPNTVLVTANAIYGTTEFDGTNSLGMIYSMNTDGTGFTPLYNFNTPPDGYYPQGGLVLGGTTLYGTAGTGGTNYGGTVFKININGSGYQILHWFTNNPDGLLPPNQLVLAGNTLFGTTAYGGTNGTGTIFAMNTDGSGYTILYNFTNSPGAANPIGGLTLAGQVMYGSTRGGGTNGTGAIYEINTNGSGYQVLHSFTPLTGNTDGTVPETTLTVSGSCLYGTATSGGINGGGTLFLINTNGSGFTVIASFTNNDASGWDPQCRVLRIGNNLWGTTSQGNGSAFGTLYSLALPAITMEPQSVIVSNTSPATFTVSDADDLPVTYQWYFNTNTLLAGQTANVLTLARATNNNAGYYTVSLADSFGTVTSIPALLTVIVPGAPPVITTQPQSIAVVVSNTASFTNVASGTPPLYYQWYFNTNTLLSLQTNAILVIPSAGTNQAGYYTVIVTNLYGSATSSPALLTVSLGTIPSITQSPKNYTVTNNFTATFTNTATGTEPLVYEWYFNTNTFVTSGTDKTVLTISPATTNQAGYYQAIVTNLYGSATSAPALLTVIVPPSKPVFTQQPQNYTVTNGFNATFTNAVTGATPLHYQWYFNTNTLISLQTNAILTITAATTNQAGYYTVVVTNIAGNVTSSPALLTVLVRPGFTQQPQNYSVTNGYNATFTNAVAGTTPVYYQWYFNTNTAVAGGTNAILTITFATTNQAGHYTVVASNLVANATSSPALLTVISTKPIIFTQPAPLTVTNGAPYIFTVMAAGQPPLKYQWYTNKIVPAGLQTGQTNSVYSNSPASLSLSAYYFVIITNELGKATSSTAFLTVLTKPIMTLQPLDVTVTNGNPATFTAAAEGPGFLGYQWYFRTNTGVAGATNMSLTFTNAITNLAGYYDVRVTNSFGAVTSSFALLTVSNSPNLLSFVFANGSATFAFADIPKGTNRLWVTTNLAQANAWRVLATNVMATNGLWLYTDPNTMATNNVRLYRFSSP